MESWLLLVPTEEPGCKLRHYVYTARGQEDTSRPLLNILNESLERSHCIDGWMTNEE